MERSGRLGTLALAGLAAILASSALPAAPAGAGQTARPVAYAPPPRPAPAPPAGTVLQRALVTASPAPPPPPPPVPAFPPRYRVGALYGAGSPSHHFCTASVVDSPHRNLLVTAAHCVHGGGPRSGYRTGLTFAPGLRRDGAPAGVWRVREALAGPTWLRYGDPAADVAFLVVEPLDGQQIQDVVGGNPVAVDGGSGGPVQLVGYPRDVDTPVVCDGLAVRRADQLRVRCPGFSGGTSGGPWLTGVQGGPAAVEGSGTVTGVIGGFQLGGRTPDVSYSSRFGPRVRALYDRAAARS